MIALHIADIKEFTSKLFLHEDFDSFLVSQASFTTGFSVTLDGSLHKDYFTDEQWEAMEQHDLARWSLMRPLCFQIIKGLPPSGAVQDHSGSLQGQHRAPHKWRRTFCFPGAGGRALSQYPLRKQPSVLYHRRFLCVLFHG